MALEIEVVIPHRDRLESLRGTLDSLRGQTVAVAVCVVDNGSSDGTAGALATDYPEVRVVALERNLGFGAAVNRGVQSSDAQAVVFINNDAVARPDFVQRLVEAYAGGEEPIVAGCMVAADGSIETLGVEVDRWLNASDCCFGERPGSSAARTARPLGPSGGAAFYEREAFLGLGGYDERIFAYLEDADLALRARLAGFGCAVAPEAVVVHEHSATLGSGSAAKNEMLGYSQGFLAWRYGANLSGVERATAALFDLALATGKAAIDRNLGAIKGRVRAWRTLRAVSAEEPDHGWSGLPLLEHGPGESLRRRLLRRR